MSWKPTYKLATVATGILALALCALVLVQFLTRPHSALPRQISQVQDELGLAEIPVAIPHFRRGVNLSRLQSFSARDPDRPGFYRWPPFQGRLAQMSDFELRRLSALGFDFVRLPVDAGPFLAATPVEQRLLIDELRNVVVRLLDHDLAVLVDMHPANYQSNWRPRDILGKNNEAAFAAYEALLVKIAQRIKDLPPTDIALELMNEPQPECWKGAEDDWTTHQVKLYETVRGSAPDLPIVLTGGCWSSLSGLDTLDPRVFDGATLFDIHFYDPHGFTHQSIPWSRVPTRYIAGLSYPAANGTIAQTEQWTRKRIEMLKSEGVDVAAGAFDDARQEIRSYYRRKKPDLQYIEERFSKIEAWSRKYGIAPRRIVIGEFSAIRPVDGIPEDGSRLAWLKDVRMTAEANGFGWALWDYFAGFGLLSDNETRTVDKEMAAALGLHTDALKLQPDQP